MTNVNQVPKLSLIVPTLNEATIIEQTLLSLSAALEDFSKNVEVVIMDDGTDHMPEIMKAYFGRSPFGAIKHVRNQSRLGKGASIKRGFEISRADVVGFIDADLSTSPELIKEAFSKICSGHDVYIAVRQESCKSSEESMLSDATRKVFKFMHALILFRGSRKFPDTQCGFKFFKRDVALDLYRDLVSADGLVDLEVLVRAHRKGFSIGERVVPRRNTRVSKRSLRSIFVRESISFLRILIRYI